MRKNITPWLMSALIVLGLSGCGSSSSQQEASTGIYKDAGVVAGLTYKTPTQSGITDEKGTFRYMPGETVTFSVSNITIGQATGAAAITTFDLVGITPPTKSFGIPMKNPTSNKFQQAINISLFLQTLDIDGNAANGIDIPKAINQVAAATPIDFTLTTPNFLLYKSYYSSNNNQSTFQMSPQLKTFIGSCRSAGIWGGTKAIKQAVLAANTLYQGLGISPSVYLPLTYTYPDSTSIRLEYAPSGLQSKLSNYDSTGTLTNTITYTYDANGNLLSTASVYATNPSFNSSGIYTYDANGNQTQWLYTYNGGNNTQEINYQYDINGNATIVDILSNGVADGHNLLFYNSNGTLSHAEYYDASANLNSTSTITYNDNLTIAQIQHTTTGQPTSLTTYTYNSNKDVISANTYLNGSINNGQTATYDVMGNPLVVTYLDNTGTQLAKYINTWDTTGYLLSTIYYDASNQIQSTTNRIYDANGSVTSISSVSNGSTSTTTITNTNQSGWGRLLNFIAYGGNG